MVVEHYQRYFDMIFHFKAAQNLISSTMKYILTWFSTLSWLKNWLQSTYERYFDLIFPFKADQNLVAELCEIDFDMLFHVKAAQIMVALHYERDLDMIFCFNPLWTEFFFFVIFRDIT